MTRADSSADRTIRSVAAGEGVRVLLVDRERSWRAELSGYLGEEGFEVMLAGDPAEAEALLSSWPADLVLLQTTGGCGGLSLCRRLSAQDGAPVILMSDRARDIDRIVGLEVGADDFVHQACSHRELLARMRAVLRRRARRELGDPIPSAAPSDRATVRFAGWTLSPWKLQIESAERGRLLLSPSEFKLLTALLDHPQETITRERMTHLVGLFGANLRSLDTAVCRLRRKLGSTSTGEVIIRTVHGAGYMLNCPVQREGVSPPASMWSRRKAAG